MFSRLFCSLVTSCVNGDGDRPDPLACRGGRRGDAPCGADACPDSSRIRHHNRTD